MRIHVTRAATRSIRVLLALAALVAAGPTLGGCQVAYLIGGMMQNEEYQKQIQVLPKYEDLSGRSVAVIVDADLSVLYDHPQLIEAVTSGVSLRIGRDVPDVRVANPGQIIAWQWRTPQWNAMPYGELPATLGVDRVVYIDIYEYRLNPPGNRWLWEGVCAANIGIIEREGFDPDMFADSFNVVSEFPTVKNVDRAGANEQQIQTGLLAQFIKQAAWLFHEHVEPKYPDKFRPEASPS